MRDIEPQPGAQRTTTWYAWWPVSIGRETRWLEYVTARQIYCEDADCWGRSWYSVAFVDDDAESS